MLLVGGGGGMQPIVFVGSVGNRSRIAVSVLRGAKGEALVQ